MVVVIVVTRCNGVVIVGGCEKGDGVFVRGSGDDGDWVLFFVVVNVVLFWLLLLFIVEVLRGE